MSEDGPREYDHTDEDVVDHQVRRRAGYSRNQQTTTRYVANWNTDSMVSGNLSFVSVMSQ